jgi:hypothetical protein
MVITPKEERLGRPCEECGTRIANPKENAKYCAKCQRKRFLIGFAKRQMIWQKKKKVRLENSLKLCKEVIKNGIKTR